MNYMHVASMVALALTLSVKAQSPIAFEVAVVKRNLNPPVGTGAVSLKTSLNHGRLTFQALTLKQLMSQAYSIPRERISGCPSWCDEDKFDVVAKAADSEASSHDVAIMLQVLLTERFKLVAHREQKETSGYALVIGKNGPNLQEAKDEQVMGFSRTDDSLTFRKMPMSGLASFLLGPAQRPVVDMTGLTKYYDFTLDIASHDAGTPSPSTDATPVATEPGGMFVRLSTAIENQLGLKLESRKVSIESLLVEKAERLSEN